MGIGTEMIISSKKRINQNLNENEIWFFYGNEIFILISILKNNPNSTGIKLIYDFHLPFERYKGGPEKLKKNQNGPKWDWMREKNGKWMGWFSWNKAHMVHRNGDGSAC